MATETETELAADRNPSSDPFFFSDQLRQSRRRHGGLASSPGVEAALLLVAPLHVLQVGHLLGRRRVVHLACLADRSELWW
jgi:hypothetical protein